MVGRMMTLHDLTNKAAYIVDAALERWCPDFRYALYERIGGHYEDRRYLGHGDMDRRRGWQVGRWTFWLDKDYG